MLMTFFFLFVLMLFKQLGYNFKIVQNCYFKNAIFNFHIFQKQLNENKKKKKYVLLILNETKTIYYC